MFFITVYGDDVEFMMEQKEPGINTVYRGEIKCKSTIGRLVHA